MKTFNYESKSDQSSDDDTDYSKIKFMDNESDTDHSDTDHSNNLDDVDNKNKITSHNTTVINNITRMNDEKLINHIFINSKNYPFKSWIEFFPNGKVKLDQLLFTASWRDFFDVIERKKYYNGIERILSNSLRNKEIILPHAELVFNAFNTLSPKNIKVVFIGQDPYPNATDINNESIPQATGFSFSVPLNYPKPASLKNIYENLFRFRHINQIPQSGCLSPWILQGCFMINAALTTLAGKKNVHQDLWKNFTNDLLTYINTNFDNIVFVAWGGNAHRICQNIDPKKHLIITSSHPSPLGYDKTLTGTVYGKKRGNDKITYPSFKTTDHFGKINSYLKSVGKNEIIWDLID